MSPRDAWRSGWQAVSDHPWLALIPMGWGFLRVFLAWLGIPPGPVMDAARLAQAWPPGLRATAQMAEGFRLQLRAFFPSWLPTATDLQAVGQPEALTVGNQLSQEAVLGGLLLVPALEAAATGLFLALLAQVVSGGAPDLRLGLRRALQALPALFLLMAGARLAMMILPIPAVVAALLGWWLLFALAPVAIAAAGRPLLAALTEAPGALWGDFRAWWGLIWRTLLTTALISLVWGLLGGARPPAMVVYPFFGTGMVGAAVALYLHRSPQPEAPPEPSSSDDPSAPPSAGEAPASPADPAPGPTASPGPVGAPAAVRRPPARRWLHGAVVLAIAAALASAGDALADQWDGFRANREANFPGPFPPAIVYVREEGDRELILYRHQNRTGIAELARSRFGWKLLWSQTFPAPSPPAAGKPPRPASLRYMRPHPRAGGYMVWGELHDSRAAYLEVAGQRYPVGDEGPLFLIPVSDPPQQDGPWPQNVRLLDAQGHPLYPDGEVGP